MFIERAWVGIIWYHIEIYYVFLRCRKTENTKDWDDLIGNDKKMVIFIC